MRVSIQTTEANGYSNGKPARAEFDDFEVHVIKSYGASEALIEARATKQNQGKSYEQKVEIHLSNEDIEQLVEDFRREGLIAFPGEDDLLQAKRGIDALLRRLAGEGPKSTA